MRRPWTRAPLSFFGVWLVACRGGGPSQFGPDEGETGPESGSPSDSNADTVGSTECDPSEGARVGLTRLRRLTRTQLDHTIRDLVGVEADAVTTLVPDEKIGPFDSNAIAPVTDLLVEQSQELAARVALAAVLRMQMIAPCDLANGGIPCATSFVEQFGLHAFRRPLEPSEVQAYVGLYELGLESGDAADGFRLVVEGMLQSPSFLYHVDSGESGVPTATAQLTSSYELASRLSYFLWNSMPDDELFDLAASGELHDGAVLAGQVERMLASPKSSATISLFHDQWLSLTGLEDAIKDPAYYPDYDPALVDEMIDETHRFVEYVLNEGDGRLETLLTSNLGFPEDGLFAVYGVIPPQGFVAGTPVSLPSDERSGLLTQAAFLTRHAHGNQSSPVHRGLIVRQNVMCQAISPPPANANTTPPPPSTATSTRERFEQHVADPACAGCHSIIDPPGIAFEHYDAIGAYRTVDGLGDVDASGEIIAADDDLIGPFDGAIELTERLAASAQVKDCVANQWFRFALGRIETVDDSCSTESIHEQFRRSNGNVRELLSSIAQSDAFRHVRATAGE